MLCSVLKYSKIVQWFLPLLLLFPFVTREVHLLLEQHEERKVCQHQGEERHIHQDDAGPSECYICDFTFSSFEVPERMKTTYPQQEAAYLSSCGQTVFHYACPLLSYALRGPPMG